MSTKIQLTRNAIMYISLGFLQPCIVQVLALRQDPASGLEMVVYDGTVYAGALLPSHQSIRLYGTALSQDQDPRRRVVYDQELPREEEALPRELDVVWMKAVLVGKNQPMEVSHLKVVRTGLSEVLGAEILSLEEYMRRRRFSSVCCLESNEDLQDRTRKQLKRNQQGRELSTRPTNQSQKGSEICEKYDNEKPRISFDQEKETLKNEIQFAENKPAKSIQALLTNHAEGAGLEKTDLPLEQHRSQKDQNQKHSCNLNRLIEEATTPQDGAHNSLNTLSVQASQKMPETSRPVTKESHQRRIIQVIRDEDNEITQIKPTKFQKSRVIDLIDDNEPITQRPTFEGFSKENHLMIGDLYERMHRFSVLCRINSITHFRSQKGNLCTKLMLIDKQGDEIQCSLFEKTHEKYINKNLELVKGRAYIFQNGEVQKDDSGCLSISVPWSGVRQTKNILQSFNPTKMRRVAQIESIQSGHFLEKAVEGSSKSINTRKAYAKEVHVCGILKRIKDEAKLVNNQFRIVGLLCDPEHQKSITFGLYVEQLTSFPLSGAVISLHNMRVAQYEGTFRLQSTKRSYFLVENNNSHQYYADLQEISLKQTWKLKEYKNISEVTYVPRTIATLKQLLQNMIEHTLCYSEIDCNIANIFEKKEYTACSICHHETKPPKGLQIYCYYCKKIEKWNRRFIFTAEVADSTGSLDITVYSSEVEPFINSLADEYANLSRQERKNLLELSSFQNLLVKIKSQKIVGGSSHIVFRAEKMSHKRGLEHIKEQTIQSKTKYAPAW